jgi:4-hydroxy-tetrahydrodipicolinate synthase
MFHGSMVALVTPMFEDGSIAIDSLRALVEWHINHQTNAIVPVATTGEASLLSFAERQEIIRHVVEQVNGRIPVIASTAANSTQQTCHLTQQAMQQGVDGCLLMTPAYIKPTQEGLYLHYQAIAKAVGLPLILYNVPGRTVCDLLPDTIARLAEIPNIVGIKEATGQITRITEILTKCEGRLDIYSGDDATTLEAIYHGAIGGISVTANVAPELNSMMYKAALANNRDLANSINDKLMLLHKNLFLEANPIPVKWALNKMGLIPSGIRLPLTPLSNKYHEAVNQALHYADIRVLECDLK